MKIKEHTSPEKLERYSFLWSLAHMVITAVSLFFGATPIFYTLTGSNSSYSVLSLFWLISGAAVIYLLYLWNKSGRKVFGGDHNGTVLFFIMVASGLNLGLAGLGNNIGMNLIWNLPFADILFKIIAVAYLGAAYLLWQNWQSHGQSLFDNSPAKTSPVADTPPHQESNGFTVPETTPESTNSRVN